MKNLLKNFAGVLAGLLFGVTAAYAIKGGPQYALGTNLIGTHSGVLRPHPCASPFVAPPPAATPSPTPQDLAANSIGIFTVGVPSVGLASGTFILFAEGHVYNGTVQAVADPKGATVKGIINAREALPNASASPSSSTAPKANGNFNSRVIATAANLFSTGGIRMRGSATLYLGPGTFSSSGTPEITQNFACA